MNRWTDANLLERVETMEDRLARGDSRMGAIEDELRENTAATAEILEIVRMGKSFFKVLSFLGNLAKWVISIGTAVGLIYAAITHKGTP